MFHVSTLIEEESFLGSSALMMKAVPTSETSVYFHETLRRYIPECCHLHTRRRENLKSNLTLIVYRKRIIKMQLINKKFWEELTRLLSLHKSFI
jgi:hypothetical protein